MKLPRRRFLKTTLAASAVTALSSLPAAAAAAQRSSANREYYELRCYRLKPDASSAPLEGYLEKTFIPALNRRGVAHVGVFKENEPKDGPAVWVLAPYSSLDTFVEVSARLNGDPAVLAAGAEYLHVPKASPAFDRIESWLLLAFAGMPTMELPEFSRKRQPRLFEMRVYESYSEVKALKKIAMFNDGEIDIMRDAGLNPVFFGQALSGPNLPHLTYMTSAPDADAHKKNWDAFRVHPGWVKMRTDPQYADTVSKNIPRFLIPTAYSQI